MNYCTIICDIKSSRKLKDRDIIQYKIIEMLKAANNNFAEIIASPFLITLGDEWEGLLKYPCNFLDILSFFNTYIPDVNFYTGIGIGKIIINDFDLTVNQLDGPSFYRSREAINYAKSKQLPLVVLFDNW
ncbi:SatD family protein [Clostridium akagii]|uniref:SatD family protein n=1 Tax=Clostridium akagii TaxID=91623 RepID=UPI00047C3416|nr:SatD family protein [Clostridium akagii]